MNDPGITILLDSGRRHYQPGETLTAEYRIDSLALVDARAIEVSVLWYTMGKGDEDIAVHHFVRQTSDDGTLIDWRKPQRLRTVLPMSPLSYEGVIVKVRWCVRVRLFPTRGKELTSDTPFHLGTVPAAQPPLL